VRPYQAAWASGGEVCQEVQIALSCVQQHLRRCTMKFH
jgi:hypothetical protein